MPIIEGKIKKIFCIKGAWASFVVATKNEELNCAGSTGGNLIIETQNVKLEGDYDIHPRFGKQFKITKLEVKGNATLSGIVNYLCSGFVKGIGPNTAVKIVDKFGSDTMDIIKNKPERLLEIGGISAKKLEDIKKSISNSMIYMDILKFFDGNITENQVEKIYDAYKNEAVNVLKKNPYKLIYDIKGFGFKKVDKLALTSGIKADSPERIGAAIVYTLRKIAESGNCYCLEDELEENIKECLSKEKLDTSVPIEQLADVIVKEVKENKLCLVDKNNHILVYLANLRKAELMAAKIIRKLADNRCVFSENINFINDKINEFEEIHNVVFDDIQKKAAIMAKTNNISCITGGPGMGKTTVIQLIIHLHNSKDIVLLAPTGKAAKKMSEVTGRDALTIAKFEILLKQGKISSHKPVFIVDETSMVDIEDACSILQAVDEFDGKIIFVGDPFQLPSIGAGSVLRDLAKSRVSTTELQFSYRFGGKIAANANKINKGIHTSQFELDDTFNVINSKKEIVQANIVNTYMELYNQFGVRDVMCLVPMRVKSMSGANIINTLIREKVNPPIDNKKLNGYDIRIGDRVMNIANNYKIETYNIITGQYDEGVFNGDMGVVTEIDYDCYEVTVLMDDNRKVVFYKTDIAQLVLAYCISYHKSQGSESKAVIAVLNNEHFIMSSRNLLYTGITRAKEKCVLIGDVYAFNKAIDNESPLNRNTLLVEEIEKAL